MLKICITVHSNSKKPRVEDRQGVLHIYVSEPPIEGRANSAVVAVLAKHFSVAKSLIKLDKGQKAKIKTFIIYDNN